MFLLKICHLLVNNPFEELFLSSLESIHTFSVQENWLFQIITSVESITPFFYTK